MFETIHPTAEIINAFLAFSILIYIPMMDNKTDCSCGSLDIIFELLMKLESPSNKGWL